MRRLIALGVLLASPVFAECTGEPVTVSILDPHRSFSEELSVSRFFCIGDDLAVEPLALPGSVMTLEGDVVAVWRFVFGSIAPSPKDLEAEYVVQFKEDGALHTALMPNHATGLVFWLAHHFGIDIL